nr:MAG TPA: hypothetical protein [Caudoviricetes sp.]
MNIQLFLNKRKRTKLIALFLFCKSYIDRKEGVMSYS